MHERSLARSRRSTARRSSFDRASFWHCSGRTAPGKPHSSARSAAACGSTSGEIRLFDRVVDSRRTPPELGIVPQEIALYPLLTRARKPPGFRQPPRTAGKEVAKQTDWALEQTGLSDRAKEPVKQFSGGMRRRLNIACGVLHRPRIVLLDEPTVGVDPQSRDHIYDMLAGLAASGVSLVAHDTPSRRSGGAVLADGHHRSREGHRRWNDCGARRSDGRTLSVGDTSPRRTVRRGTMQSTSAVRTMDRGLMTAAGS